MLGPHLVVPQRGQCRRPSPGPSRPPVVLRKAGVSTFLKATRHSPHAPAQRNADPLTDRVASVSREHPDGAGTQLPQGSYCKQVLATKVGYVSEPIRC